MDEAQKKRNQWLLRLTDAQDAVATEYMEREGIEEKSRLIQACIAYTMAHCPRGQLEEAIAKLRELTMLPPYVR